jgi:hypothetical protein
MLSDQSQCSRSGSRFGDLTEGIGIKDSHVGQNLTVQLDISLIETTDQFAVGHAVNAGSGVDPGDPQTAEITFTNLAVTIGIRKGPINSLSSRTVQAMTASDITSGQLQDLVSAATCFKTASYSGHFCLLATKNSLPGRPLLIFTDTICYYTINIPSGS